MCLTPNYKREILSIENIPEESATGWENVLLRLKEQGVKEVNLFVTGGLKSLEKSISIDTQRQHIKSAPYI